MLMRMRTGERGGAVRFEGKGGGICDIISDYVFCWRRCDIVVIVT
jgi:hypothetical protein